MKKYSWGQHSFGRAEMLGAVVIVLAVLSVLLFASLRKKPEIEEIPQQYIQEMGSILEMMATAPHSGDFEISYPSSISEKDMTLMRVGGKTTVIFRNLGAQQCQWMAKAAMKGPFTFVLIEQERSKTIYEVGNYDYALECLSGAQRLEFHQK